MVPANSVQGKAVNILPALAHLILSTLHYGPDALYPWLPLIATEGAWLPTLYANEALRLRKVDYPEG